MARPTNLRLLTDFFNKIGHERTSLGTARWSASL